MTITAKNYFEKADTFISKLPSDVKEAHNLIDAMRNDGIEDPFNTGDADIDEMGALLLKQVNQLLQSKAEAEPKAAPQKEVKTKPAKKSKPAAKKAAPKTKPAPTPKQTPIKAAKKTAQKTAAKKVKTVTKKAAKKMVKRATAKVVKQVVKHQQQKAAVKVKKYSYELQFIKSFAGMNDKTYKTTAILNKYKALKNALEIGKATAHIDLLKSILMRLGKAASAISKSGAETIHIKLETGFLQRCKEAVNNATVKFSAEYLAGTNNNELGK